MSWIINTHELAGRGQWHWSAQPTLAEDRSSKTWSRMWVSARPYNTKDEASRAADFSLSRIRVPQVSDFDDSGPMPLEPIAALVDAYTLDKIDGELVVVTPALPMAVQSSRWAGNTVYCRDYLLSLLQCALESGVLCVDDLPRTQGRQAA
ncbi:MAG: hypothetical protein ABIQ32_12805 [Sphingomicrobium sp.]